jgi:hypothetical protein
MFDRLAAEFFKACFREAFVQETSVPEPLRQEYIIYYQRICVDSVVNTAPVHMFRWKAYECSQAPVVPHHFATANDLLNWLQAGTRLYVVKPSCLCCGPVPNALLAGTDVACALLVTPPTTIVRPVAWFLLLILPPNVMPRMAMMRQLMVVFRPFTLMSRGFALKHRDLKMRRYTFEPCSDTNVLQHGNIVDALSCSQVCLQGLRHPVSNLRFIYTYIFVTYRLSSYFSTTRQHRRTSCSTVRLLQQQRFLFALQKILRVSLSRFQDTYDATPLSRDPMQRSCKGNIVDAYLLNSVYTSLSFTRKLARLSCCLRLFKTQGSASPWKHQQELCFPVSKATLYRFCDAELLNSSAAKVL